MVLFAHHSARMRITRMEYERINLELSVSTATNPPIRQSFRQCVCEIDLLATAKLQLITRNGHILYAFALNKHWKATNAV